MSRYSADRLKDVFVSPAEQVVRLQKWSQELGWGFTDEDFARAKSAGPRSHDMPRTMLVAPVLVPYLADVLDEQGAVKMTGVVRTFHELWKCAAAQQKRSWAWDGFSRLGTDGLRLLKGNTHPVGLQWEVIDFGAHCYRAAPLIRDIRRVGPWPHAGVLAAAVVHSEWARRVDCFGAPRVWIPGYQMTPPSGKPWSGVPALAFDNDRRRLELFYGHLSYTTNEFWSVPALIRRGFGYKDSQLFVPRDVALALLEKKSGGVFFVQKKIH